MRSYPIYNRVTRDYNSALHTAITTFGARDAFLQSILVGTSASNSHELGTITVERRELPDNEGVEFALYIDNTILRRGILVGKEFTREDITEL